MWSEDDVREVVDTNRDEINPFVSLVTLMSIVADVPLTAVHVVATQGAYSIKS